MTITKIFRNLKNKLIKIIQRLAIDFLDPIFVNRHPNKFIIKLTEKLSFIMLNFQPNDRWSLHVFVAEWTKIFLMDNSKVKKKHIFMFSCYRGRFSHNILLAIILARKGHQISLGYLPKLRSAIKNPLNDSHGNSDYISYVMQILEKKSKGKIKSINLTNFYNKQLTNDRKFYNQAHSDTVMMLKKENIDLKEQTDKTAFQFCLERLKFIDCCINNFFKTNSKFDLCLISNGATFENSQILQAAKKFNIHFNTFEKFAFKNAITLSHQSSFVEHKDLDILLKLLKTQKNEHNKIKAKIKKRSENLLQERKNSTGNHWGLKYQKQSSIGENKEEWFSKNIKGKKFVLICPNVPFDAGYGSFNKVFPQMKKWLLETIKFILTNSDLLVVVRAHPAEDRVGFGNEKTDFIIKNAKLNSNRLIIIPSSSFINTYELMDKCFFGSVYSSTTGVEIAMSGKFVVAGANIYHARVNVTKGATNIDQYFKIIKSLIDGSSKKNSEETYKAYLVYYLFHFVLQHPYPYDKPSNMAEKPINKYFYKPEFSKYDLTFKLLTMNKKEYLEFFQMNIDKLTEVWN